MESFYFQTQRIMKNSCIMRQKKTKLAFDQGLRVVMHGWRKIPMLLPKEAIFLVHVSKMLLH